LVEFYGALNIPITNEKAKELRKITVSKNINVDTIIK
jgi:hypothetical protein